MSILEIGFAAAGDDREMWSVDLGADAASRIGVRQGANLRVWTGTAQRPEKKAVVLLASVLPGEPNGRLIHISPRLQALLDAAPRQSLFLEAVSLPPCDRVAVRPLEALPEIEPAAAAAYVERVLQGTFHALSAGMELPVTFPAATRPQRFRVESVEPAEALSTRRTRVQILDFVPSPGPGGEAIGYEEIGGLSRQLRELRELLEFPLRAPAAIRHLGITPCRGVILCGPPGTGKSLMVRALGAQTGAHVETINGPEILTAFQGGTEQALRDKFAAAASHAPAIVLIDEIDAIAPKRKDSGSQQTASMVAQLLTLLDGLKAMNGVVVAATTNRINQIDPALRRPGRFAREIYIPAPDREGRLEILRIHARRMPLSESLRTALPDFASRTHGYVGADLMSLCFEAGMNALRRRTDVLAADAARNLSRALVDLEVEVTDFELALSRTGPSALRETAFVRPETRWQDIGGYERVKARLREIVELPLREPEAFARLRLQPSRGVVLHGPPGTGKTLFAKAIANECEANFILVNGPELFSKWVGETEERLRELFEIARQAKPCIIFFDEIDALLPVRGRDVQAGVADSLVNQFLAELDGVEPAEGVVVIGATNRLDRLDPAVLRPGRLGEHIEIGMPDPEARRAILAINLAGLPFVEGGGPDGVLADVVARTEGFSGAQLAELVNRIKYRAIRERAAGAQALVDCRWMHEESERFGPPAERPGYRLV